MSNTTHTQIDIIRQIRDNINDNMTLPAIKQLAKHLGISKYSTMKKQDIIQKITEVITSYPITKQTEIKEICEKSRNIGEDVINYLNQPAINNIGTSWYHDNKPQLSSPD